MLFTLSPCTAREKIQIKQNPDAICVQAQPGSLRYPSPKNSPPDCFYSRNVVSAAGSFESPSFQFDKKSDPTGWDHFFGGKRGIHSVTPRLKTVHRTVFTAETLFLLPAHSNPPLSNSIKKVTPLGGITFFGGKRGIRTLGAFIGHTRFPVVRLRPAQPSFHNGFCCVHSTRKCLIIISGRSKKVKLFLQVRPSSVKRSRRPPQGSLPEGSGGRNFYLL